MEQVPDWTSFDQFMLDRAFHNGYEEIAPPLLVRPESMQAAGQYLKLSERVTKHSIVNLH